MKLPSWPILVGGSILLLAALAFSIMTRLGSFKTVEVQQRPDGESFLILARDHMGPYHKIADLISDVETWARSKGEPCERTFGEYFDNPETTDEDRLRSRGGCILSNAEKAKALEGEIPKGMSISELKIGNALEAIFEGSPAIAPLKVYPRAQEIMKDLGLVSSGPVVEIYEVVSPTAGRTRYLFPVKSARDAAESSKRN